MVEEIKQEAGTTKKLSYKGRLTVIKKLLKRPWHFFRVAPDNNYDVLLELQSPYLDRLSFRGKDVFEAISEAERYIEHEREMNSLP
jgi:hypothetical protein